MSEARSSRSKQHSWLKKLSRFFWEPKDLEQVIDSLRSVSQQHVIDAETLAIAEGALSVSQMQARDVMIPRSQVVMVSRDASAEETLALIVETAHSRFPVIDDDRDDVIGILLAKDLLAAVISAGEFDFNLRELLRPAVFIPESKRLNVLLREFRARRNHMAIVVDEYGGVSGLVTIEDVLEEIVGEIEDETDVDDGIEMIVEVEADKWLVQAQMDIEDFNEHFKVEFEDDEYDTVSGLLLQSFGHLPANGETTVVGKFHFEIVEADNRRIISAHMSTRLNESVEMDDSSTE